MKLEELKLYQLRMLIEYKELDKHLDKLGKFIYHNSKYRKLKTDEKVFINHQYTAMNDYRINLLNRLICNGLYTSDDEFAKLLENILTPIEFINRLSLKLREQYSKYYENKSSLNMEDMVLYAIERLSGVYALLEPNQSDESSLIWLNNLTP